MLANPGSSLPAGHGRIAISTHSKKAVFTELSSTYPLKLLSPKINADGVAVVYVLSYGGGLVGGDQVSLTVDIKDGARGVLLSQGSTKVFKRRVGTRMASGSSQNQTSGRDRTMTVQTMKYVIGAGSGLFLLPEPVTCFRDASYSQIQHYDLDPTASLVLLDSITAGRQAQGEDWDFSRYYSVNQIRIGGKLVANDVLLLEDQPQFVLGEDGGPTGSRSLLPARHLRDTLAPYSCYAMAILCGPLVQDTIKDISAQYEPLVVYQRNTPENTIWSLSLLDSTPESQIAIVRVASVEAEAARLRLKVILRRLEHIVGAGVYRRAFS